MKTTDNNNSVNAQQDPLSTKQAIREILDGGDVLDTIEKMCEAKKKKEKEVKCSVCKKVIKGKVTKVKGKPICKDCIKKAEKEEKAKKEKKNKKK